MRNPTARTVLVAAAAMSSLALLATPAGAATTSMSPQSMSAVPMRLTGPHSPSLPSVKLTCSANTGTASFVNWDILVQLNADGTARSAAPLGDAYLTGADLRGIERTDPPSISIKDGGRYLEFHGSALTQLGIPNTPASIYGVQQTCIAGYHFPNPTTTVYNFPPGAPINGDPRAKPAPVVAPYRLATWDTRATLESNSLY